MENLTNQKELAVSIIQANPIDVVERIGKHQFIYDYKVPSFLDGFYPPNLLKEYQKEGISNASGLSSSVSTTEKPYVAYTVNPNPEVGAFSKGNIVNVLRFEGANAIIENPNYIQPDPNAPKSFWAGLVGELKQQKEFTIPKDYLQKVDDSNPITIETGINFGANPKYQLPFKTITSADFVEVLEENATFVLNKDFQYVSGYGSSYCSPSGMCTADMSPKYSILKAGTEVTGRLFRKPNKIAYKLQAGIIAPPNYNDYLAVKGYGDKGSIDIPTDYLTKKVINNVNNNNNNNNNNGLVVPVSNNNKNLLMIVGAFLVGYVLFGKGKKSVKN